MGLFISQNYKLLQDRSPGLGLFFLNLQHVEGNCCTSADLSVENPTVILPRTSEIPLLAVQSPGLTTVLSSLLISKEAS